MATKPNFRPNTVSKVDLTSTLQRGAISRFPDPPPAEVRPAVSLVEEFPTQVPKRQIDSRKKKLAHMKTLLEYEERKDIIAMLREVGDVIGHDLNFSIYNRGLLLAALAQKSEFLRAAEKFAGLVRPSNGDVDSFREYEAQIAQLIFRAFDIRGEAPRRSK